LAWRDDFIGEEVAW